MISLSKANDVSAINLSKDVVKSAPKKSARADERQSAGLDFMPQYSRYDLKTNFKLCYKALSEFKQEFYPIHSATYFCELKKQAKRRGDEKGYDKFEEQRKEASKHIKAMRKAVYEDKEQNFDEKVQKLRQYIKENSSYMNCSECSDIMLDNLRKKGLKADNIFLYTVNNEKNRVNFAEHVFTVAGIDDNADINNPETWGKDAVIVDGWAGICMGCKDGIEYYKKFFNIDSDKYNLAFELN